MYTVQSTPPVYTTVWWHHTTVHHTVQCTPLYTVVELIHHCTVDTHPTLVVRLWVKQPLCGCQLYVERLHLGVRPTHTKIFVVGHVLWFRVIKKTLLSFWVRWPGRWVLLWVIHSQVSQLTSLQEGRGTWLDTCHVPQLWGIISYTSKKHYIYGDTRSIRLF